jgi:hypothetical protein
MEEVSAVAISVVYISRYEMSSDSRRKKRSVVNEKNFWSSVEPSNKGPPLVGRPRLLIQYIRIYPTHLQTVSSVSNLRMCPAVVTEGPK